MKKNQIRTLIWTILLIIIVSGISVAYTVVNRQYLICIFCSCEETEHLKLYIEQNNLDSLESMRARAIEQTAILKSEKKYVDGLIAIGDTKTNVSLRLKGDMLDHIDGERCSYRIKSKNGNRILGLKKFSIQDPKTRNFIHEWIFHNVLEREDIIHLGYEFVQVSVNEEYKGIYAMEEHFNQELIEKNGRPNGIIACFSEDQFWEEYITLEWDTIFDTEKYLEAEIKIYDREKIMKDDYKSIHISAVENKLKAWRRGELSSCDIFECEKLATFLALSDLTNARHANRWHNKKFYYNIETEMFELIGFDTNGGASLEDLMINHENLNSVHQQHIFSDEKLRKLYFKELERIASPRYLDGVFSDLNKGLQCNLELIRENKTDYEFSKMLYYGNQDIIKQKVMDYKQNN